MSTGWFHKWGVLEDGDAWNDPVPGIKIFEQDFLDGDLSAGARLLHLWLRFVACHGQLRHCSREQLAKSLQASTGSVSRWLGELAEAGMLDAYKGTWLTDPALGQVYFIQAESGGPIKIGKAVNPKVRLAQLQTSMPEPLKIIGVIQNGGLELEKQLHERFAQHRIKGEWFLPADEIIEFIGSL